MSEKVSIIIPTYNRAKRLGNAIISVLSQTHTNYELIIIDDGSTDNTEELVGSFSDRKIVYEKHSKNKGVAEARNTGLDIASGEYICFLDSDDEWKSNKLEVQLKYTKSCNEDCIGSYTDVNIVRESALKEIASSLLLDPKQPDNQNALIVQQLKLNGFIHAGSTLLLKKSVCDKVGGFNTDLNRLEEVEFVIRCLDYGKLRFLDRKLVTLHDTGAADPEVEINSVYKFQIALSDIINQYEKQGYNIRSSQNVFLLSQYLALRDYNSAVKHLQNGKITNTTHIATILYGAYLGVSDLDFKVFDEI
ncbi:glycosyltransferase family 2 protein [Natronosalvus amylolyticus]|uniref:glycosyltransferase family 2 protein n=1 Tax=Natronosalvus amylolyticus TaxID=2961994 RepID=UPI0020CA0CF9|nr:glycosyltransferase family A protein [Natronosalvus amylolyticus]